MDAAIGMGADSLLIAHLPDVRWLSGFTGSNGVIAIAGGKAVLCTDGRYTEQARAEAPDLRVLAGKKPAMQFGIDWLLARGATRCAFEARHTTVAVLDTMRKKLPKELGRAARTFFLATEGLVERLREIKDADEIGIIRRAADLGCELFAELPARLVPGTSEAEIALTMEFAARTRGAEAMSFDTIVASGARSALPHGKASAAPLPKRGFVTIDFGVVVEGYCSDMTRTVHMGRGSRQARSVYDAVLEAQGAAIAAVAPGVPCAEVDKAARTVLKRAGLAKYFTHSTGHGVGLEIHEGPRLAAGVEPVLEPGMVITVEPGVYLPGVLGVRIEDMVLVTEGGAEVLTSASPKTWMQI